MTRVEKVRKRVEQERQDFFDFMMAILSTFLAVVMMALFA